VASGDPLADRVILWTRAEGAGAASVEATWRVARDPELRDVVVSGNARTGPERDYTVKVDAPGLAPDTRYWYAFSAGGHDSPTGRTRTLPAPDAAVDHLRLAFTSCANYPVGFFNVYGLIAQRPDLDLVLHLGDYIYEYANGRYGDGTALGRIPLPDREIVSLDDYRLRYATYRSDPDLQEVHATHPFVCIWNDHELAGNAWRDGAGNHDPATEGSWRERRRAAVQAYLEWMPIRETGPGGEGRIYRSFRYGRLADLCMLDARLVGRSAPARAPEAVAEIWDRRRSILGPAQEAWLFDELRRSKGDGIAWRILGQQVMLGQLRGRNGLILDTDQWDGYAACRERLLELLKSERISDTVVLTGDLNSSWAQDICLDPYDRAVYSPRSGEGSLAVEFVTPAVTSPDVDPEKAEERAEIALAANPHLKWVDLDHRGYAILDVTPEHARAEWYFVDTVTERHRDEYFAKAWQTMRGRNALREARPLAEGAGF
jgi:alkaline phosphatase D